MRLQKQKNQVQFEADVQKCSGENKNEDSKFCTQSVHLEPLTIRDPEGLKTPLKKKEEHPATRHKKV